MNFEISQFQNFGLI